MFWTQHPSLPYAIVFAIGIRFGFDPNPLFFIPLFALFSVPLRRLFLAFLTGITGFLWVSVSYQFPPPLESRWEGSGYLEITSLKKGNYYKQEAWLYRGVFQTFNDEEGNTFRALPVSFIVPSNKQGFRPQADAHYFVRGVLTRTDRGFQFKAYSQEVWEKIGRATNLIEQRVVWKEKASLWIDKHIPHTRSAHLLKGLLTGDFDDKLLIFDFSRFGLQHLMAISGFHFSVIASLLSLILSLIFPRKPLMIVLSVSLSLYFLFLGPSPSIVRAWFSSLTVFLAQAVGKQSRGLNTLGIAFLLVLVLDPLSVFSMGCLFSFGVTAAILLFFEEIDRLLQKAYPARPFLVVQNMTWINQIGMILLTFIRKSLSLNIAVTLIALPMTLYFFHQFPFLSLFYNLFFPFLVSFSMFLLLLALLTAWIPPLSHFIHLINSYYTDFILNLTHEFPQALDVTWVIEDFPLSLFIFLITIIYFLPLHKNKTREYN